MSRQLVIDNTAINDDTDCYVIAEIGNNHQGDVEVCKKMFVAAKDSGANAVKLQKRDNRTLFTREIFDKPYDHENSFAETYGEHREYLEFGKEEYMELKAYAAELGITMFATAFDIPSADFLQEVDLPAFKMASADLLNLPLLKHVAKFSKPMVMSIGGATMDDVHRAYDAVMPINSEICILQCTSRYPADYEDLNLRVIEKLREQFPDVVVGYSGHDNGIAMALVAYMLGGRVVEKHFTLNRAMKGTDHSFSLAPDGLRRMIRDLKRARISLGDGIKRPYESETAPMQKMAKSLVAGRDLPEGHVLTDADVAAKIPPGGLPPYELDNVLGKKLTRGLRGDEMIAFADLTD